MTKLSFVIHTVLSSVAYIIILLNPIQISLQWGISILSLSQFFPLHQYTPECNSAKTYPNFDLYLSLISSVVAFYLIPLSIYVLARMITPTNDIKRLETMRNEFFKDETKVIKVKQQPMFLVILKYVTSLFAFDILISYGISYWLRSLANSIRIARDSRNRTHLLYVQNKLNDSSRRFYPITGAEASLEEENLRFLAMSNQKVPDYILLLKQEFFEAYHYKLIMLEIDDDDDETKSSLVVSSYSRTTCTDIFKVIIYMITLVEVSTHLGHFTTRIGNECWRLIFDAYRDFFLVAFGFWDSHGSLFRNFKITETIGELSIKKLAIEDTQAESSSSKPITLDELKKTINPILANAKKSRSPKEKQRNKTVASLNEVSELKKRTRISTKYKNFYDSITLDNEEEIYKGVIISKLGTKCILLQLVPVLSMLSLFLVATVGSPLLVYDEYLLSKLPYFLPNPTQVWKDIVNDEMRIARVTEDELYNYYQYKWTMSVNYYQNLCTSPRLVSYIVRALPVIAASVVVFAKSEEIIYYTGILVSCIMIPYYVMRFMGLVIIIGSTLRIKDDDFRIFFKCFTRKFKVTDSDINSKSNETNERL